MKKIYSAHIRGGEVTITKRDVLAETEWNWVVVSEYGPTFTTIVDKSWKWWGESEATACAGLLKQIETDIRMTKERLETLTRHATQIREAAKDQQPNNE